MSRDGDAVGTLQRTALSLLAQPIFFVARRRSGAAEVFVTADCAYRSPQHSQSQLSSTTHGTTGAGAGPAAAEVLVQKQENRKATCMHVSHAWSHVGFYNSTLLQYILRPSGGPNKLVGLVSRLVAVSAPRAPTMSPIACITILPWLLRERPLIAPPFVRASPASITLLIEASTGLIEASTGLIEASTGLSGG